MLSLVQMFFVPFFLGVAGVGGGGVLEGREDNVSLLWKYTWLLEGILCLKKLPKIKLFYVLTLYLMSEKFFV